MENNLLTFTNVKFGQIRAMEIENEPWFVGKDVAGALGYVKTANAIKSHVDEEDKKFLSPQNRELENIPNRLC